MHSALPLHKHPPPLEENKRVTEGTAEKPKQGSTRDSATSGLHPPDIKSRYLNTEQLKTMSFLSTVALIHPHADQAYGDFLFENQEHSDMSLG